ncbi:MAG: glycosyltransferase, partial [Calditrichia bacterium]
NPVDLIIGTVPPFTAGMAAAFANMLFHIPCVLDFRDAWTHNPYLPEISPFHSRLQSCLENFTLRRSAGVIFVNPKLEKYYLDRYPVLVSREIVTIRNGYDPEDFINKSEARSDANPGIFRIGIMGTVYSQGNAPMPLLRAVAEMKKDDPTLSKRLQLVFIGKWANNFIQEIRQFNIDELIDWVSYLPHREALKLALQMDAQALAVQSGLPGSKNVTPGRIYEYLYLKKPILAMCPPNSDLADLVSECRAGEFVEYDDIPRVRGILNDWLKSTDKLTSRYEFKNLQDFHRKQLAKQLLAFLSSFK